MTFSIADRTPSSIELLGGVGHCYAWHVRVTFCIGNVCSLSNFQFGAIGGLYMIYHTNKQKN